MPFALILLSLHIVTYVMTRVKTMNNQDDQIKKAKEQERANLIRSLADSMGLKDIHDTQYDKPEFDKETCTLYCDGLVFRRSTIDKIKDYYMSQMEKYRVLMEHNKSLSENYMQAAVAYNTIVLLETIDEWNTVGSKDAN